jgi:hypothetical protein
MKHQVIKVLLIAASCMTATSVLAIEPANASSNYYVGASLGIGDTNWDPLNSTGLAFNVLGGYHLDQYWSFEGSFTHFPDATGNSSSINENAFAAMAKMSLPLGQSAFKIFTKVGLGYTFTGGSDTTNCFGPGFAVGVGLPLQNNFSIEASYTLFAGKAGSNGLPDTNFYGITMLYNLPANVFTK